ncbi:MAG: hypothetical protein MZU84_00355 [Sphingobacterium sp.]|nr:hypothetical protein [Sphingobacterium sp.]
MGWFILGCRLFIQVDENFATRNKVKLKVNSGSYIDLTADYLKDNTSGFKTYHCFKDITSILQANGLVARYTVANVATDIGAKNLFGGWTIVCGLQRTISRQCGI